MDRNAYEKTRQAFVRLCLSRIPTHRAEEVMPEIERGFDELCGDERVRFVAVKGDDFHMCTFPLVLYVQKLNEYYGPAAFWVYIRPIDRSVMCENLEGVKSFNSAKAHHPHVNGYGTPCLAENSNKFQYWFTEGRVDNIAMAMLDFLELLRGSVEYVPYHAWNKLEPEEIEACLSLRRAGTK